MVKRREPDPKEEALKKHGALNPQSEEVRDPLFHEDPFFDPRDLVQVKYEMLRQVRKEGKAVTDSASSFGFSRPSFYEARSAFEDGGLSGLLPKKRGPRGGHKLTGEVLAFIEEMCAVEQSMGIPALLEELEKRFGIRVHRRSLERARRRCEKKTPPAPGSKERQPR